MRYETLSRSEEDEHGIISVKEIVSILKHIAENATQVALYYADGNYFVLSTLLGVNDKGLWLEQSTNERDNKRILESDELILVSIHLDVKVQFTAKQAPWAVKTSNLGTRGRFGGNSNFLSKRMVRRINMSFCR